jgi:peptidoglycan/xylan/chitin deacetylase (PgdA/CDA1 family)
VRVPILCYHRVEVPPASATRDTNFVTPACFAEHLAALSAWGFTGITVSDLLAWQRGERALPARSIAITFDDAYASVVSNALPLLAQRGWRCTIFAVTAHLGGTNAWDPGAPRATLLDAAALRDARSHGHDVGAHSRHHRRLRGLAAADCHEQLVEARAELEQALGAPCESVAFPYGSHDRVTLAQVEQAGYRGACTLKRWANGRRTNPLRLGRMSVGGPLPAWMLMGKLAKMFATPAFR